MRNARATEFVEAARDELGATLSRHGFEAPPLFERLDKQSRFYWPRRDSWKVEAVELWFRQPTVHALFVSFRVYLPGERLGRAGETVLGMLLDGVELDALLDRSKPYYVEGLLRTPGRLARRIGKDAERGLHWFRSYPSPQECLRMLEAGETMWGEAPSKIRDALAERLEGYPRLQDA